MMTRRDFFGVMGAVAGTLALDFPKALEDLTPIAAPMPTGCRMDSLALTMSREVIDVTSAFDSCRQIMPGLLSSDGVAVVSGADRPGLSLLSEREVCLSLDSKSELPVVIMSIRDDGTTTEVGFEVDWSRVPCHLGIMAAAYRADRIPYRFTAGQKLLAGSARAAA